MNNQNKASLVCAPSSQKPYHRTCLTDDLRIQVILKASISFKAGEFISIYVLLSCFGMLLRMSYKSLNRTVDISMKCGLLPRPECFVMTSKMISFPFY